MIEGICTEGGISIHAPTKGATTAAVNVNLKDFDFNPRSHEGSDEDVEHLTLTNLGFQSTLPRRERHYPTSF